MRWELAASDESATRRLQSELGLMRLPAAVLAARGLADPEAASKFLAPDLAGVPDPFLLAGMVAAVERLRRALAAKEPTVVYADYDVDGCTSAALLVGVLKELGLPVRAYVPHRLVEGYGLNPGALTALAAQGTRLVVTADCGVTNVAEVDHATKLGLDVIVIDHHKTPAILPRAAAVVNPHQPGCAYPDKGLAAVGVSFLLLAALRKKLAETGWTGARPNLKKELDLVALGTIADCAPLSGVNRVLVHHGLAVLSERRRAGVRALCSVAGLQGDVTAGQVGFKLGPRINAAGRLDDASIAVELLTTTDPQRAERLAQELDSANAERQAIEAKMREEAFLLAAPEQERGAMGLVLASEGWHAGVVGIVAARVAERFRRPAIVLALEGATARGSARSVEGFHLYDALKACSSHLTRYGGHRQAAGLALHASDLGSFRQAFEDHAHKAVDRALLEPRCRVDASAAESELTLDVATELSRLAPFGLGNPEPVFVTRGLVARERRVLPQKAAGSTEPGHLKVRLASGISGIGFAMADREASLAGPFDAAFSLELNEWQGNKRVELRLRDVAVTASA